MNSRNVCFVARTGGHQPPCAREVLAWTRGTDIARFWAKARTAVLSLMFDAPVEQAWQIVCMFVCLGTNVAVHEPAS